MYIYIYITVVVIVVVVVVVVVVVIVVVRRLPAAPLGFRFGLSPPRLSETRNPKPERVSGLV